jgi:hypothetical protein
MNLSDKIPGLSEIQRNFDEAKYTWAQKGRLHTVAVIRDQFLSGQALGRRTGTLVRSIQSDSEITPERDGFTVGTNLIYGVAWEFGFHRRAFEVYATTAKALAFQINGVTVFAKHVSIPAQDFAARPFIQPGIQASREYLVELGEQEISSAMIKSFPEVVNIIIGGVA